MDEGEAEAICWLAYTGGTTGRSKGVMIAHRCMVNMSAIIFSDWEWPQDIRYLAATPITHAGGVNIFPTLMRGGFVRVLPGFDIETYCRTVEAEKINTVLARADDGLCADRRQGGARAVRPLLARDDHLRRRADVAGPPARGHGDLRRRLRAVLRPDRGPPMHHDAPKGRSRSRPSAAARLVRASESAGRGEAVRPRDERGQARASRARSACAARW